MKVIRSVSEIENWRAKLATIFNEIEQFNGYWIIL